jgi:tetratricopeptide (TPR) repeat protein
MRTLTILLILGASAAWGQRHKAADEIDTQKPDGALLMQGIQEKDDTKKAVLLEEFCAKYPKDASAAWALEALQNIYVKAGQLDKIIATGEKLLVLDPDDPESALQNLKAAEGLKDLPAIRKWVVVTSTNARKMASQPQPKEADAVETWKSEVSYAKQVDTYSEYALFRVAIESRDPKVTVDFAEALAERNPESTYVPQVQSALFNAYRQSGASDKAVALAERVLAKDESNEDMMLVVADDYSTKKKEPEKVHAYTAKAATLMAAKSAPAGMSAADWETRQKAVIGIARYLNGKLYYNEKKWPDADRELRAALPLVDGNPAIKAETLFYLGFANFSMQKGQEAANFYKACAAIPGPFQAPASKNLQSVKSQYTGIK